VPAAPPPASLLLRVGTRAKWRAWLAKHHATAREVWLVYAKPHTGRPRVPYADAVEEALCFGWIDTTVRRLDADEAAQRFTPRRDVRKWSRLNLERFARLVAEGRMTPAGAAARPADVAPPARRFQPGDPIPAEVRRGLAANAKAHRFFESLAPGYRRDYVRWMTEAKRPETRARRVREALRRLARGQKRPAEIGSRMTPEPRRCG
jgi:uncharacterized protein YdeI (YjbR/CyaY-like superfamily)